MKLKALLGLALVLSGVSWLWPSIPAARAGELPLVTEPKPPYQHRPWKPPETDLPTNLVSTAKILFDLGLADPRGCDYREFETVIGDIWGGTNDLKVHGWVLPAESGQKQRFVIGWDGLIYPAASIGAKASLKQDVEALLRTEDEWRKEALTNNDFGLGFWPAPDEYSTSQTNVMAGKVIFLLRLGQGRLAQEYWHGFKATRSPYEDRQEAYDPFHQLAGDWAWSLFDRAVSAHVQGDDARSLAECRQLTQILPELEGELDRRGFPRPLAWDSNQKHPGAPKMPYFNFLDPLPALLADEEERIHEPPREAVLHAGLDKFPDKSKRVAALILDLNQIHETQAFIPGGVYLGFDPTVKALIAEGDDAVIPLVDCMANDHRLTRSVNISGQLTVAGLVPVRQAAQTALSEFLMVDFDTAAEYRSYWQKYQSQSQPERWYQTLLDDHAGRKQWLQAGIDILSRTDGKTVYLWKNAPIPDATNGYRYVAAALHSRTGPSVADLFLRRALEIAPTNFTSSEDCWTFGVAADLGLMLAEWDPQSARHGLAKIIQQCPALYADSHGRWGTGCAVVPSQLAALAVALARLGDTSGLDLYAGWLGHQDVEDLEDAMPGVLTPLGRFPDQPSIKAVSTRIFQMQKFDWMNGWMGTDFLHTHLVQNEAFRQLILQALTNKTNAGTFVLLANGQFQINTPGNQGGGSFEPDTLAPKVNDVVSFRVCDDVASRLSRIENVPELKVYWPEAKRDAVIVDIIQFLNQNGNHLKLRSATWPVDED